MITKPVSRDGHGPIVRRKLYQDVMDRLLDLIEQPSRVGLRTVTHETAPKTPLEGQLELVAHGAARIRLVQ